MLKPSSNHLSSQLAHHRASRPPRHILATQTDRAAHLAAKSAPLWKEEDHGPGAGKRSPLDIIHYLNFTGKLSTDLRDLHLIDNANDHVHQNLGLSIHAIAELITPIQNDLAICRQKVAQLEQQLKDSDCVLIPSEKTSIKSFSPAAAAAAPAEPSPPRSPPEDDKKRPVIRFDIKPPATKKLKPSAESDEEDEPLDAQHAEKYLGKLLNTTPLLIKTDKGEITLAPELKLWGRNKSGGKLLIAKSYNLCLFELTKALEVVASAWQTDWGWKPKKWSLKVIRKALNTHDPKLYSCPFVCADDTSIKTVKGVVHRHSELSANLLGFYKAQYEAENSD